MEKGINKMTYFKITKREIQYLPILKHYPNISYYEQQNQMR